MSKQTLPIADDCTCMLLPKLFKGEYPLCVAGVNHVIHCITNAGDHSI